jgi:type I restriction enzyme S subunit
MTARLPDHLDLIATAPGGIQKLRGLILELAVRGKLVPQDAADEPAGELLKRIADQKVSLASEGVIKKEMPAPEVSESERPFEIPVGWKWSRLSTVLTKLTDGTHHSPLNLPTGEYKYISAKNIKPWGLDLAGMTFVTEEAHNEIFARCNPEVGDVLYIKDGATTGVVTINTLDEPFSMLSSVALLKPSLGLLNRYLLHFLSSPTFYSEVRAGMTGVAITRVTLTKLGSAPIALPPLAEQHRIVAKVDELMALCDRLEAEQADAESAHARIIETLLRTLTQSADADELAANWQRLAEHFDSLFTTDAGINALKQTVLQLAVTGKLVQQNADDEPASSWLIPTASPIKKGKQQPLLSDAERAKACPFGWKQAAIEEFCDVQGGLQKTPHRRPVLHHFPYLRVANVQRNSINLDSLERFELTTAEVERWQLLKGDLLVVEGNGSETEIGRCAVWDGQMSPCVYQNHLIRVRPNDLSVVPFLQLYLNSPTGMGTMKRLAITTSGLYNLSVGKIRGISVLLPPLAEQHRIVTKVDELMALCDRLKADLVDARARQARLADTLIDAALAAA